MRPVLIPVSLSLLLSACQPNDCTARMRWSICWRSPSRGRGAGPGWWPPRRRLPYRLDIYSPEQSGTDPISTTSGINAAKIAVDFWRKVYALNYEVIPMAGGGPPPFTEPSISLWTPNSSCTGASCSAWLTRWKVFALNLRSPS